MTTRRPTGRQTEQGTLPSVGDKDTEVHARLLAEMDDAERKAWDALSRYKFYMFGYWAAAWVKFNHIGGFKRPNPFRETVQIGRRKASEEQQPTD